MTIKHILCFFLCLMCFELFSQKQESTEKNNLVIEADFGDCVNNEYAFRINGQLYSHKNKFFVCPCKLEDTVRVDIVHLETGLVQDEVTWIGINPISPDSTASAWMTLDLELPVTIEASSNLFDLKLKIRRPVLTLLNGANAPFGYDDNKNDSLLQYHHGSGLEGVPYKFLIQSPATIGADVKKKAGYYAIEFSTSDTTFVPSIETLQSHSEEFSLVPQENIESFDSLNVSGCNLDTMPELRVFVGDSIFRTITFVSLCDTVSANAGCPVGFSPIFYDTMMTGLNEVYNPVGVFFNLDAIDTVYHNYDLNNNGFMERQELLNSNMQLVTNPNYNTYIPHPDLIVFIVPSLDTTNTTRGRATDFGTSTSIALSALGKANKRTIAHEIGHECFGLHHPRDVNGFIHGIEHPYTFSIGSGQTMTVMRKHLYKETDNLMYFNGAYEFIDSKTLRAFQFRKIHSP